MKIRQIPLPYGEASKSPRPKHKKPRRPLFLISLLIRLLSVPTMLSTRFTADKSGMARAGKGPYLILMNHSSFTDMKIAYKLFFPLPFSIVCTVDAFVGKAWLLRLMGCIPTQKFVTDINLVLDMVHAVQKNGVSVLMYPEAGYSIDGTAGALPRKLGQLVKKLGVPVLMVKTEGAFLRDPLYNALQLRKTRVSATVDCLFTREELEQATVEEIDRAIDEAFTFDAWREQNASGTVIDEAFRADFLHRILYRCPVCGTEGEMEGKGTTVTCRACEKEHTLTETGKLQAADGKPCFEYVSDWYAYQRACVKREIDGGTYRKEWRVDVALLRDHKGLYMLGEGTLIHDENGFLLTTDDGALTYRHSPRASHSLNADFHWYEIGDVIGIGTRKELYYCFPKDQNYSGVTKARLAAEELYKLAVQE